MILRGETYAHSSQKRACDLVIANLLSPAMVVSKALTKRELRRHDVAASPNFQQPRVGANGILFMIQKFTTLLPETETTIGAISDLMRRTGLDETSQIVNIRRGDMSAVGHRPIMPVDFQRIYDSPRIPPQTRQRHREIVVPTRPGSISSWGLVSHVGVTDARTGAPRNHDEIRMELNIKDVVDGSPLYDLALTLKTLEHAVSNKLRHGTIRSAEAVPPSYVDSGYPANLDI